MLWWVDYVRMVMMVMSSSSAAEAADHDQGKQATDRHYATDSQSDDGSQAQD